MAELYELIIVIIIFVVVFKLNSELVEYKALAKPAQIMENVLIENDYDIRDYVPQDLVKKEEGKICAYGPYDTAVFSNTNSMLPIIDYKTTGIIKYIDDNTEIKVGDIVTYFKYHNETLNANFYWVHRIIEIGNDENGTYYIFKGDHNPNPDVGKVRRKDLKELIVGVIW